LRGQSEFARNGATPGRRGDEEPPEEEIDEYISRLNHLKLNGAQIALVQIYSASVPVARPDCRHMPLKTISRIRQRIKAETGLQTEVF
jgi:hypothetical protein